jgi:hypothetical protein
VEIRRLPPQQQPAQIETGDLKSPPRGRNRQFIQRNSYIIIGLVIDGHWLHAMDDAFHEYKNVKVQLQLRELTKGGWTVTLLLDGPDNKVGTKYEVKTIYSSRMEAEMSGFALARQIIDHGEML